jgi:putative membrane protein
MYTASVKVTGTHGEITIGGYMIYKIGLKKVLTGFLAIVALNSIYPGSAPAQSGRYDNWHMGPGMMGDWGMGGFGMIFMMILFWGLVIFGVIALIRWLIQSTGGRSHSGAGTGPDAMDILKKRYAKGEIARDEFETMKKEILR